MPEEYEDLLQELPDDIAELLPDELFSSDFNEIIKGIKELSGWEYIINIRLLEAMKLLSENNLTGARVALLSGWSSPHYFSRVFKEKTGITPGEFSAKCRILYPKKERYLDVLQETFPDLLKFLDMINN